jgi:hypothetical protein
VLLTTICVDLRVVAGRRRTGAGSRAVALRRTAWHGRGMASVNQAWPHCVNQMGKTHSKPLAARHGRGTAWARHAMCESAFKDIENSKTGESVLDTQFVFNCL